MSQDKKPKGMRGRTNMGDRQMEAAIAIGAIVLLAVVVTVIFMFKAWGPAGTFWRLFALAVAAGTIFLIWRNRRTIVTSIHKRREASATRAAEAAAALAAIEARRPRPLSGHFPPTITFLGPRTSILTDHGMLHDPLIYAVQKRIAGAEPSLVISELPVTPSGVCTPEPLPYWPSYSNATPEQRSVYVDWIVSGRKELPREIGYAFMFFYGLERRVLVDRTDLDLIIDEVIRLRFLNAQATSPNRSFDTYTGSFLWFLAVSFPDKVDDATVMAIAQSTRNWHEDNVAAALCWCAQKSKGMPVWLAIEIAGLLPGSQQSVVIERVRQQFRELFAKRYSEEYPQGFMLRSSKRSRTYQYKAASGTLGTTQLFDLPNPSGLMSQFKPLSDLWNDCISDLRRLSSVVHREGAEELTPTAWRAMPEEMRAVTEHPLLDPVCRLVQESTDEEGRTLITVRNLAGVLRWQAKDRCSLSDSVWISQTVEECGYCLEPDTRLTKTSYDLDETVTVFLRTTDEQTTTGRYAAAACMLRFGMEVAAADGHVHPDELAILLQDLEQMFDLNEHERRRLEALRTLMTATGTRLAGMSQLTKLLDPSYRQAIAKLLLVLASKDGEVTKEEIQAIRKCYKAMGIAQSEIGHALNSLRAYQSDEEPVTILPGAAPAPGEAIPSAGQQPAPSDTVVAGEAAFVSGAVPVAVFRCIRCNAELQVEQAKIGTPIACKKCSLIQTILNMSRVSDKQNAEVRHDVTESTKKKTILKLNRAAIAQIMADTHEVAKMLAEAMNAGEQPGQSPFTTPFVAPEPATAAASVPTPLPQAAATAPAAVASSGTASEVGPTADPTLPPRYADFYHLLVSKAEWDIKEADGLARQQGLMLSGAIDAINEWAAEKYGGQLFIEDGAKLCIEQAYLN